MVIYKGSIQAKGADRLSMAAVAVFLVSVSVVVRKEWGSPALLFCKLTSLPRQKPNTVDTVTALAQPVVAEMGLQLWDVRFEKEGASWYLRLFIDKEGGVTIDDCENLSRRMDKILDEADPISQSYYFEVSSPGIGRDLVRPWHFERYLGEQIEVKLIRPMQLENGSSLREFVAPLCSCDDQTITVELDGQQLTIEKKDAAYIRLYEQISFK